MAEVYNVTMVIVSAPGWYEYVEGGEGRYGPYDRDGMRGRIKKTGRESIIVCK